MAEISMIDGLSVAGFYLLFFIFIHAIEIGIIELTKHMRRRKARGTGSKAVQTFLDPRKTRSKIPIYMVLFSIVGLTEAYLKIVEGMTPDDLMVVSAAMIFLIYLLMMATIRMSNYKLFFSILAVGFLVIFISNYLGVMIFTEQVTSGGLL